jgi:Fe-S-cluster-containing dehydrogenase component
MSDEDVDRLLTIAPFSQMDPAKFPPSASLRDLLRNDTRIVRFQHGDIVFREGDYHNSAFFIISGTVRVLLESLPESILGRRSPAKKNIFDSLAQLWRVPNVAEGRDLSKYAMSEEIGLRSDEEGEQRIFLQDVPIILERYKSECVQSGEFFGEISALGRTPRQSTVISEGSSELLEIRWQGLRDLRRRSPAMKDHIDALYRERSMRDHFNEIPIFQHLNEKELSDVLDETRFESYGEFDWYGTYKALAEQRPADRIVDEAIIAGEEDYPNGLILIRSGFARVTKRHGHGHRTVSVLGRGRIYGFEELVHNWRSEQQLHYQCTLRAIGHVDILFVPTWILEKLVFPSIPSTLLPKLLSQLGSGTAIATISSPQLQIEQNVLAFLAEERFINGTATMMINLDRCTRCDDCVRACALTHDNNPRFIRHGKRVDHYMIANACMHCSDPVCLIGCPTGAIHRETLEGQVVINDRTCIGCGTCATNCPYENIRMVEIRDMQGSLVFEQQTNVPIMKATKCDLCVDQLGGPACQRACPHDALQRVDMRDLPSLANWLNR